MGLFTNKKTIPTSNVPVENTTTESNTTSVITDQVKQEINSLRSTSNNIASSINEVTDSVNTLSNATVSQSQEIDTAATILRDFSDNMEKLAYNVTNVQIKVYDTDELSNKGITSIEKLDSSLNDLQSAFTDRKSVV